VQALIVRPVSELMALDLSDGSVIKVQPDHVFWVDRDPALREQGWLTARRMHQGDRLRTISGRDVTVVRMRGHVGHAVVYTLTVARDHTFFVGSARVLVHNSNAPCLSKETVAGLIDEDQFNAKLKHALEWFGVKNIDNEAPMSLLSARQIQEWRNLIVDVGSNSHYFLFTSGADKTIAHLGYKDGKWLVVQFYRDPAKLLGHGTFATAFRPNGPQLDVMKRLAGLPE